MKGRQSLFSTIGNMVRVVDRVVNEIQQLILDGQLQPGDKLPPERELADKIGVSRTVIREAVRILVTKGLLETKPGVGTIVRHVTRDRIVEPLSLMLRTQDGDISFEDFHQVRTILEIEIAGLAAAHATEVGIAEIKQIMADMEANRDNPDVLAEKDTDFHQTLAHLTLNPLLELLLGVIRALLQDFIAQVLPGIDPIKQVFPYHQRILNRVAAREEAGARRAMQEHLAQSRRNYEEAIATLQTDASPY